jgi:acyl-CoA hydrolase
MTALGTKAFSSNVILLSHEGVSAGTLSMGRQGWNKAVIVVSEFTSYKTVRNQLPPRSLTIMTASTDSFLTNEDVEKNRSSPEDHSTSSIHSNSTQGMMKSLPSWVGKRYDEWGELLKVDEWKEDEDAKGGLSDHAFRQKQGWYGRDLLHDLYASVRILEYYVQYGHEQPLPGLQRGGIGTKLTGVVHFTRRAESHQGFCHGGSMTSVMDDVIGWNAFLVTGSCRPWTGFTVQVNTNLMRPIPVGSVLLVQATIVRIVRRKVSIEAVIYDPTYNESSDHYGIDSILPSAIHATAEGLVVINKGVLPSEYDRSSTMSTQSSSISETG